MFITSLGQAKELIAQNKDKIQDLVNQEQKIYEQIATFKNAKNLIEDAILVNNTFGLFVNNEDALNNVLYASFERTVGKRDYRPRIDISCSLDSENLSFEFKGYLQNGHEDVCIKLSLTIYGKLKPGENLVCQDGSIIKLDNSDKEYPIECIVKISQDGKRVFTINDQEIKTFDEFKKIELPANISNNILDQDFIDELQTRDYIFM